MPHSPQSQWKEIASHIMERNGAINLSPLSLDDENYTVDLCYSSRLLDMADDHLVIEVPTASQGRQKFETDAQMFLVLVHHSQRMELTCTVLDRIKFKINDNLQTIAYKLSMPSRASSAQRRDFYRATVTALPIKPISCTPLGSTLNHPVYHQAFKANLVNISGGGLGALVHKANASSLKDSSLFECDLELPHEGDALKLHLICQAMHMTTGRQGDVYIGMQFIFKDPSQKRETVDKLVKYTAWVQREHLKHDHQKT
ncbi:MAG: flagellar brake domain-containing protein [Phycisphaeraceae bacterium]|nr:flagellar brake domain-containing protein [Phycisphaeraceae bacterium]